MCSMTCSSPSTKLWQAANPAKGLRANSERTELRDAVLLLLEVALEVGGRHLVLRDGHARRLQGQG